VSFKKNLYYHNMHYLLRSACVFSISFLSVCHLAEEKTKTTLNPTAVTTPTTTPTCVDKRWCNVRLPTEIVPSHYNMELRSDVDKLTYSGVTEILLHVAKPIDVVLVHIKKKNITAVELKNLGILYI